MTLGTSPHPGTSPSRAWADAGKIIGATVARLNARLRAALDAQRLARGAATLYLGGLGTMLTMAWAGGAAAAGEPASNVPVWHLAFLMATGAAAAALTLGGRVQASAPETTETPSASHDRVNELMAQMSHELRTPLNAVIGFSEVMLSELHGPLGNARYQEYAHHISESGGRLLKSSEQALAVAEAMTALMADRSAGRRQRLVAGNLVRDAWRKAAVAQPATALRLTTCNTCEILCESRPTAQALEHLLRRALMCAPANGTVHVTGQREGGARRLTIETAREPVLVEGREAGEGLDIVLARLLLETQGATLTCTTGPSGGWHAIITFRGPR